MGEFFVLKPGGFDVQPGAVLKAGDYAEFVAAGDIVEKAKARAEQIVAEAQEVYESEKKRGFAEGVEEGKMEMTMRMLDSAMESVNMISSMEDAMVDVVMRSLRTVVGDMAKKDIVASLVKKSLQYVRDQKKIILRLNPGDAEEVEDKINEITRDYPSMARIDVIPDPRLDSTQCILETELGSVDASLEKQLSFIEDALRKEVGGHA